MCSLLVAVLLGADGAFVRGAVSEAVLAGPEATARAAAAGSNKQRVELEAAITSAVSDALHWLGAIKQVRRRRLPRRMSD